MVKGFQIENFEHGFSPPTNNLENIENNTVTLINPIIVSRWLCKILKVLNYRYGRDKTEYNKEIEYL